MTSPPIAYASVVVLAHLVLLGIGVWLLIIDARTHRLPNRIVLPTLGGAIVLVMADALVTGEVWTLARSVGGMLILGGFYAVMRAASRGGIGGGDVKLAAVIGVVLGWHGWEQLVIGAAAAFVLAALYALVLMALRRATRSTRIAFGPWMIVGALIGVVLT
ncbi:A24 family peptidase [Microbacterium sp.]|uniref:prepilin peptidase n=1 Tax=Microbacterium sp. TaxID=51671 RepID=UPI00260BB99B|nr:A24 family peptidase [Microbacterium sp.]